RGARARSTTHDAIGGHRQPTVTSYAMRPAAGGPASWSAQPSLARRARGTDSKVTTATPILSGSSDERVPIGQPMELFRALKDAQRSVELVPKEMSLVLR